MIRDKTPQKNALLSHEHFERTWYLINKTTKSRKSLKSFYDFETAREIFLVNDEEAKHPQLSSVRDILYWMKISGDSSAHQTTWRSNTQYGVRQRNNVVLKWNEKKNQTTIVLTSLFYVEPFRWLYFFSFLLCVFLFATILCSYTIPILLSEPICSYRVECVLCSFDSIPFIWMFSYGRVYWNDYYSIFSLRAHTQLLLSFSLFLMFCEPRCWLRVPSGCLTFYRNVIMAMKYKFIFNWCGSSFDPIILLTEVWLRWYCNIMERKVGRKKIMMIGNDL